jgi:hypothetical protein
VHGKQFGAQLVHDGEHGVHRLVPVEISLARKSSILQRSLKVLATFDSQLGR